MARRSYQGPQDRLDLYEAVVATIPDVERKGAANPYTSRNGWMFSFLDATGSMSLRLAADDRAAFLQTHDTTISVQYGKEMKEFVVVPDSLFHDTASLAGWFERSHDWVGTLKPKPTTR